MNNLFLLFKCSLNKQGITSESSVLVMAPSRVVRWTQTKYSRASKHVAAETFTAGGRQSSRPNLTYRQASILLDYALSRRFW